MAIRLNGCALGALGFDCPQLWLAEMELLVSVVLPASGCE